jgi:hypothetical protein
LSNLVEVSGVPKLNEVDARLLVLDHAIESVLEPAIGRLARNAASLNEEIRAAEFVAHVDSRPEASEGEVERDYRTCASRWSTVCFGARSGEVVKQNAANAFAYAVLDGAAYSQYAPLAHARVDNDRDLDASGNRAAFRKDLALPDLTQVGNAEVLADHKAGSDEAGFCTGQFHHPRNRSRLELHDGQNFALAVD